jgi:hypothetical protein
MEYKIIDEKGTILATGSQEEMDRVMILKTWDAKSLNYTFTEKQLETLRNKYGPGKFHGKVTMIPN